MYLQILVYLQNPHLYHCMYATCIYNDTHTHTHTQYMLVSCVSINFYKHYAYTFVRIV